MHSTRFLTTVMTLLVSPLAKKPGQWFNPNAFLAPISTLSSTTSGAGVTTVALSGGAVGNLGRDTLTGPGMTELDLSLLKATHLSLHGNERYTLQFRSEFFNILNHTNFTTPNAITYAAAPTLVAGTYTPPNISSTAGVITATATTSRQIQFRPEARSLDRTLQSSAARRRTRFPECRIGSSARRRFLKFLRSQPMTSLVSLGETMSTASIAQPSSNLSSLIQSGLDAQLITSNNIATVAPSLTPAASSTLQNFASDLANIFKDLAANNTNSAQTDLTELQQALGHASNAPADNSPLGKLLDSLSTSISSGDTKSALQQLVGFFTASGNTSGNFVNTYA